MYRYDLDAIKEVTYNVGFCNHRCINQGMELIGIGAVNLDVGYYKNYSKVTKQIFESSHLDRVGWVCV